MDELFEIVTEDGRVTGTATRRQCHGNPALIHQAVHVFVFDGGGRLFLQQRAWTKDTQPGRWDASVGGHLQPGEAPEDGARRETGEELGFAPAFLVYAHRYLWRTSFESELIRSYATRHDGPVTINRDELENGRFWTMDEIAQAAGRDVLTPQLEFEFPLLRAWWSAHAPEVLRAPPGV